MINFNLYILRQNPSNPLSPILIPIGSSNESRSLNPRGTYDEKLTNKSNSQKQLTFSIVKTYDYNKHNRNADLIVNGQRLRLVKNKSNNDYQDFYITKVAPSISESNTILSVTAVDWFSYELSHTAIGLTYNTLDNGGIKTIQDLTQDILKSSYVSNWSLHQSLLSSYVPRFYEKEDKITSMKISFSISNSNCYNALIEIAKKFDATIVPYYNWSGNGGTINFINNNDYNSNIHNLSPNVNINKFGINQQSNDLCTIMYVRGGQDAYGNDVTLTPQIPDALKYWLLEHICYDDDNKPGCLIHNYPILITRKYVGDETYKYYRYYNSLYDYNFSRALNSLNNLYAGLYTIYDSTENIIFTINAPTSSDDDNKLSVYINNQRLSESTYSIKIVNYENNLLYRVIEVTIPIYLLGLSNLPDEIKLWAGYNINDRNESNTATIKIINTEWENGTKISIDNIWESKQTMIDIYQLFAHDWNSNDDDGLTSFKNKPNSNLILSTVYNYCNYIDKNVPSAGNFLYNFDYLVENNLMSTAEKYGLEYVLSHDVRQYNLLINIYSQLYYNLLYQTQLRFATIKTYLSSFLAEIDLHQEHINSDNNIKNNVSMPIKNDVIKILTNTNLDILIPYYYNRGAEDDNLSNIDIKYYTESCYNELLTILSSILREGLTVDYIRNTVSLYGKDFFDNIQNMFDTDESYSIFKDKTNEYFDLLYEYDILLNRPDPKYGVHNLDVISDHIYDNARSNEAYQILTKASLIKNQASFYYDDHNNIYINQPDGTENIFFRPNIRKIFLSIIQEFVLNTNSSYYSFIQKSISNFNLVDYYNKLISENNSLWTTIRSKYGTYLLEGVYNDSTELTTTGLYNAALLAFSKVNHPIYNYSITSIDSSDIIAASDNIQVGDRISIHNSAINSKPNYRKTIISFLNNSSAIQYKLPQKGAEVVYNNFNRLGLIENDANDNIYSQILGTSYGDIRGTVIASDFNKKEFIIEWERDLPILSINNLTMLNYGGTLFFGDYTGVEKIIPFPNSITTEKTVLCNAGDWFFSAENDNSVYQACDIIYSDETFDKAIKSSYRVDVYIKNNSGNNYWPPNSLVLEQTEDHYTLFQYDGENYIKISSHPVYADFVYEAEELLLTITGTTQTLRENNIQLEVQDNSLINSLIDKLLYSVRLN